jgi:hypothetical protein
MKKYLCLPILVAILFLLSCGKENSPSSEIVRVELPPLVPEFVVDGIEPKPLGYLKAISFPQLIKKVVSVASAIKPGPQVAMLPMMVGMALGDPALTSIDPTASTTMIVFDDLILGGAPSFVLAIKLTAESPVQKQAENIGMNTIEVDGWTLATMNSDLFEQVKDWSSVLSFAQINPENDIEIGVLMGKVFQDLPTMKASALGALSLTPFSPEIQTNLGYLTDILIDELTTVDAAKFDFSLSVEEIILRTTVSAKKETELFNLLDAEMKPFSLDEAKYVSGDGWMDMLVNFNPESLAKYISYLIQKMEKSVDNQQWKEVFTKSLVMMEEGNKLYGGQAAMSYGISDDEDPISFVQVGNTLATAEQWNKLTKDSISMIQQIVSNNDDLEKLGMKYDIKFVDDSKIDGVQINRMDININFTSDLNITDLPPSEYSNTTSTYLAVSDGLYMNATSKEKLLNLLDAKKNDKPVENNLAELINLEQGQIISWRLDIGGYAKMIVSMADNLVSNSLVTFGDVMEDLENLQIPPVTGSSKLGGGRVDSEVRIPVKSIKAGFDFFESYTQKESEKTEWEEIPEDLPEVKAEQ